MPSGFPKRMVGHGWVPMTTEIRAVWSQVVPKLVKGEMREYADATWGWYILCSIKRLRGRIGELAWLPERCSGLCLLQYK